MLNHYELEKNVMQRHESLIRESAERQQQMLPASIGLHSKGWRRRGSLLLSSLWAWIVTGW